LIYKITFDNDAKGVFLPENLLDNDGAEGNILGRELKVCIFDTATKKFIGNVVRVPA